MITRYLRNLNEHTYIQNFDRGVDRKLRTKINNLFKNSLNKTYLYDKEIAKKRNESAHSGQTKTRQDALDYIETANEFLENWINSKK